MSCCAAITALGMRRGVFCLQRGLMTSNERASEMVLKRFLCIWRFPIHGGTSKSRIFIGFLIIHIYIIIYIHIFFDTLRLLHMSVLG